LHLPAGSLLLQLAEWHKSYTASFKITMYTMPNVVHVVELL